MRKIVQVIDNSNCKKCHCDGKTPCKKCTCGDFKEPNYTMIAETPDGQQIAFQTDTIK